MLKATSETERKANGTFAKGNRVGGSKSGSRHKVTKAIEVLLEGEAEGLTLKAVEMVLQSQALRLVQSRSVLRSLWQAPNPTLDRPAGAASNLNA
jgi:hypothetical protein